MSIDACVADYVRRFQGRVSNEMAFYKKQPTLSQAIRVAASCSGQDGKRHPHQRRIPKVALSETERQLLTNTEALGAAEDFDALHRVVNSVIGSIRGVGELTVYDVTHRIGAFLDLNPENVYLHAGTREGAAALGFYGKVIEKDRLPATFAPLTAAEIEDCLCIYKAALSGTGRPPGACGGHGRASACVPELKPGARPC